VLFLRTQGPCRNRPSVDAQRSDMPGAARRSEWISPASKGIKEAPVEIYRIGEIDGPVGVEVNRIDRAHRFAGTAVDALIGDGCTSRGYP